MRITPEVKAMAEIITDRYGKAYLNMEEASKVVGCRYGYLPARLHEAGFTVKRKGPSKLISVIDLVLFMGTDKKAPIDNS